MSWSTCGGEHLDRGDVVADLAVVLVLVDLPRHVQDEEPELHELGVGVGDVVLDALLVGQQAALGVARQGPLAHHVERLLAHPHGAHGVVDAPAPEPGLGDGEGLALPAEQALGGHPHLVVVDEGVHALVAVTEVLAHEPDVADDVDARACRWGPGTSTCPGTRSRRGWSPP